MKVSEWIKENQKSCKYSDLSIVDENNVIILDDRIAYLKNRSAEYNKSWRSKCRGKEIKEIKRTDKGYILVIG